MSAVTKPLEDPALRKQLLQARSTLCRLRIRHELNTMRESLSWARAGVLALKAVPVRSSVLALALHAAPQSRLARLLLLAARMLLLARLASIAANMLRKLPGPPSSVRERTDRMVIDL